MPFTKTWSGSTSGQYSNSLNWELISLRTAAYSWTVSGSGTNEYYLRTSANGDPGFAASPPTTTGVYINGSSATKGSLGSLAAGEWGYGDNDTLGYSTVYVRLSDGADPDSKTADYVQFRQIPQTGEHVRLPAGAGDITTASALDQSAVAIGDFIIEDGYDGIIGTETGYLRIDPDKFEDHGRGQVFIDIGSANINCVCNNFASADDGEYGLNLRGTNIAVLDYRGGLVGLAARSGEVSTVATIIAAPTASGTLKVGKGVTLTTLVAHGGTIWLHCSATTITNYEATLWLMEAAAATTVNVLGGETHYASSGNITTVNLRRGLWNEMAGNATRTIGTVNKYRGGFTLMRNKEAVTHTSAVDQDSYTQVGA